MTLIEAINSIKNDLEGETETTAEELLEGCLDMFSIRDRQGNLKGFWITACAGGPTIRIDTFNEVIVGWHGNEEFCALYKDRIGFSDLILEGFDYWYQEGR